MSNIPKLRFKEFSGELEESKLGDIASKIMYGMNSSAIKYDGKHKYIRITDIDESSRNFLPNPLTSPDGEIEEKFKLQDNDILFTRTGASVGKSYIYKKDDGDLYFAGFLIKFNINEANSKFIFLHTLRGIYTQWVSIMSVRSGQPGINAEEYKLLKLNLPQKQEQLKIASFLTSIDTKIEQLNKKQQLLEEYKEGIMQKIFSQEIRFKNDDGSEFGDWEVKKLGKLCKITTGKSNREDSGLNGKYTFFDRSEDIRTSDIYLFDGEAVIVAGEGSSFPPKYFKGKFDLHQRTYAIMKFDKINAKFLFYYIDKYKNYILRYAVGSTVKSLRLPIFENMPINLPQLKEQIKIANFLSSIDKKIEFVSNQLGQTKEFKKGLLQKMFV